MNYGPLLFELVLRDIKIKYRRSILGVLWTVLNPLLMMMILWMVFSHLFRFDIQNYPIYLLCGQVIFNFFQSATTDAMMSIVGNAGLIRKVYIPKYLFVLAKILSGTVNLAASFLALLVVMVITGTKIRWTILLTIFPILLLLILSTGMGLLLAALTVKFRDILHLYSVFCTGLFYLTPVIYPITILPGRIRWLVRINPLTRILEIFRAMVIEGTPGTMDAFSGAMIFSVAVFVIGYHVFKKREDYFIMDI